MSNNRVGRLDLLLFFTHKKKMAKTKKLSLDEEEMQSGKVTLRNGRKKKSRIK